MSTVQRVVIYTVVTGGYDAIVDPVVISPGCSHVCLTDDRHLVSNKWEIRLLPRMDLDRARLSRHPKLLAHRYFGDFDLSIYVDANMKIIADLAELAASVLDRHHHLALFRHPSRQCTYDEARACLQTGRESFRVLHRQMDHYRAAGYPPRNGLVAGGVIIRRHNVPEVARVMEEWWENVCRFSHRDQLSFNFAAWKHSLPYVTIDGDIFHNRYVVMHPHRPTSGEQMRMFLGRLERSGVIFRVPLSAARLFMRRMTALFRPRRDP